MDMNRKTRPYSYSDGIYYVGVMGEIMAVYWNHGNDTYYQKPIYASDGALCGREEYSYLAFQRKIRELKALGYKKRY